MSELAADTLKLGERVQGRDVILSLAPAASRWSLRARDAGVLAGVCGMQLPARIGWAAGGIAMLGPDEWYAVLPAGQTVPAGENAAVSVVDVSSRSVGICVEGEGAAALLMTGCPLDLAQFAVGRATRTLYETVEIILLRHSETLFHVEVWRSFAPWLWGSLASAATER